MMLGSQWSPSASNKQNSRFSLKGDSSKPRLAAHISTKLTPNKRGDYPHHWSLAFGRLLWTQIPSQPLQTQASGLPPWTQVCNIRLDHLLMQELDLPTHGLQQQACLKTPPNNPPESLNGLVKGFAGQGQSVKTGRGSHFFKCS